MGLYHYVMLKLREARETLAIFLFPSFKRKADVLLVYHDFKSQEESIRQCVKAIQNDVSTIIFVNNGSKPFKEVFELLGLANSSVRCRGFNFSKNEEITTANTKGIQIFLKETTSRYLAIIDPGSTPQQDWLRNVIHAMDRQKFTVEGAKYHPKSKVGFVSGVVVCDYNGEEKIASLGHYQKEGSTLDYGYKTPKSQLDETIKAMPQHNVFTGCLCAILFSRATLNAINKRYTFMINPHLQHYYGCTDLGMKACSVGFHYGFVQSAVVKKNNKIADRPKKPDARLLKEKSNSLVTIQTYYRDLAAQFVKQKIGKWELEKKSGVDSLSEVVSRAINVYKKTNRDMKCMPPDDIGDKFDTFKK